MEFRYSDGGRKAAGFKGDAGDCVVRAIVHATGLDYMKVYNDINALAKKEYRVKGRTRSTARDGVHRVTYEKYLKSLGWKWVPTMLFGQGCKVHLREGELPMKGALIVRVSKHVTAVIDGIIYDICDPRRMTMFVENGVTRFAGRCVYGYFIKDNGNG
jgi:hypothetical protein